MSDEYVRITATIAARSPDAVLLSNSDVEAWVPRSCIHGGDDVAVREAPLGSEREFQMREWFAKKKGFV